MKELNIIINGSEILDNVTSNLSDLSQSIEDKLPEIEKKDKKKRRALYISSLVVIGFCSALLTSFSSLKEKDITLYFGLLALLVMLIIASIIVFETQTKNSKGLGNYEKALDYKKRIDDLTSIIKEQQTNYETLLKYKDNLLGVCLTKDNNLYVLKYTYSEDGDSVTTKEIYIDEIESSLKQEGASLIVSEEPEFNKRFKVVLYISYELQKSIEKNIGV